MSWNVKKEYFHFFCLREIKSHQEFLSPLVCFSNPPIELLEKKYCPRIYLNEIVHFFESFLFLVRVLIFFKRASASSSEPPGINNCSSSSK